MLDQLGLKAPWVDGDVSAEPVAVQRLATKLVPLSWQGALDKGLEVTALPHGADGEVIRESYERLRLFVIDAARSANGLEWEFD